MHSYISRILLAAAASGVIELLFPAKKQAGLRLVCGLLMLAMLAAPIVEAVAAGDIVSRIEAMLDEAASVEAMVNGYAARAQAAICAASEDAAEAEIAWLLAERFGLSADDCRVEVVLTPGEDGTATFVGAKVWLSGRAVLADAAGIEDYLAALFGGQAVAVIETGRDEDEGN